MGALNLKQRLFGLLLAGACSLVPLFWLGCSSKPTVNEEMGPELHDLSGQLFRFSDHKGQWVLVNYWASWCEYCVEEIPIFNAFAKKHTDVQVVGVNAEGLDLVSLKQKVASFKIDYPVLDLDPAPQLNVKNIPGLPVTFLISPNGYIEKTLTGSQTLEALETAISRS